MKYETFYDGGRVPRLGIGTWRMGGSMSPDYSQDEEIVATIRSSLERGYSHIDTAEMYGGGHTEKLVARAVQGFRRQDLFITTKVWHTNLRQAEVVRSLEGSLRRLKMDYVDLFLIHWPNHSVPLEDTLAGLQKTVERGLARYIGVSNFDMALLKRAHQLSEHPIATNQVPYSLGNREYAENGVLQYCQDNDIILTAYSPIEKGRVIANPVVKRIAEKHGATPAQVALAWLIRQPKVITIPKAANPAHMEENLASLELELGQDDLEVLRRA
jgi:diketogulonate reductase-like aldo/keto reductase